ncbi:hypothetical protein KZZ52_55600 [Dactylosporangium sp. AC04546]|uniref:hypothetical protein n=1 Tax=Dactylosporangium sp. AC04546 TaxID=2862460 RepID=UPI001EE0B03A|nr:hypothetical protein [Dactylosporangium sp. AC04546]WVK83053.1 hypothetical protein KZZ52_55600 [Dactylosporangium sp. AC04546]
MTAGRLLWTLVVIQGVIVALYGYAAVAYLTSDAGFFPEQAPPVWAWPAVAVVGLGFVPAATALVVAVPGLASPRVREDRRRFTALAVATTASALVLAVMATPPGWVLFDWYVS